MRDALYKEQLDDFGKILHENWILKQQLASQISNDQINQIYSTALKNGASGGKLLGAGGGGLGASNGAGSNGTDGFGGGGGGGAALGYAAGNGGTGVVIIRYAGSAGDFTTGKNASGIYRSNISLVVTVYSPGKVTFYAKSKIIPGCNRIITVGSGPYTASCSYKLSTHGSIPITAKLVPDSAPGSPILLNGGSASIAVRSSKR